MVRVRPDKEDVDSLLFWAMAGKFGLDAYVAAKRVIYICRHNSPAHWEVDSKYIGLTQAEYEEWLVSDVSHSVATALNIYKETFPGDSYGQVTDNIRP